jgi:hypothetical protein
MKPGWWHEENECPNGNPDKSGSAPESPLKGGCNDPSCDCVEFFQQAVMYFVGTRPGWESPNFPLTEPYDFDETRKNVMKMLSNSFKLMLTEDNGIPQNPINGEYDNEASW